MSKVRINLNATVTVRLTDAGRDMVVAHYRDLLPGMEDVWPKIPAAGEPYQDQLWSLMHMLGPKLTMGHPPMIESMTVTAPVGMCVEVAND